MRNTVFANRFDTIVVGVGGMGSAALHHMARRGKRVLGLERFDVPHDMGSSHGYTRIIRLAYYEHPSYVMLLKRAYELWREIEQRSGERLLHITGSIDAGPADSWVFKGSLQSCMEHDLPHEVYTGLELRERFPGYQLPHEILALYQPEGGFLAPERCIVSHVFEAMRRGAEIHGREPVLGWEPLGDEGVRVFTERATYEADNLVITAGAWNDQMLGFLDGLAVPERQVLAWFQPERPELFQVDNFPVFNLLVDEGRFYGFPVHSVPGFKIGKYHHFEESGPAEEVERGVRHEDEQVLRDLTSRYFPQAAGPTMTLKSCMFTNAPDGHFLIDLHPQFPQVSYASACSGHGFKFASVIGEILADLAQYRQTRHNIELFSHERFGNRGGSAWQHGSAVRRHASRQHEQPAQHQHGLGSDRNLHRAGDRPSERRARQQDLAIRSPWR
ncbi:MAG: N-methyl-L-tryptophan oxidase [Caldilineaceae bacterium]|nr:N-methyl-L-tryptophan oxidase [Caldilineaceae bacterium]